MVKRLGQKTDKRPHPYPLGRVKISVVIQVDKRCKVQFGINAQYLHKIEANVISLDAFDIVPSSPYLYVKKAIFMRRANKDKWVMDGVKYIIKGHYNNTKVAMVSGNRTIKLISQTKQFFLL